MKKVVSILLAVLLLGTVSLTVFAATDISALEQKIIDAASQSITVDGKTISLTEGDLNSLKTYLTKDDVDLSEEDVATIVEKINDCFELVEASGVSSLSDLSAEDRATLMATAQEAADVVEITISYDSAAGEVSFVDAEGAVVASNDAIIKTTGANYTLVFALMGLAIVAAAAGALFVKKSALAK